MDKFQVTLVGGLVLLRAGAGGMVFVLGSAQHVFAAALVLIGCVWLDAGAAWITRGQGWQKTAGDVQLEGFADFLCFVIAPAVLAAAAEASPLLWPFLIAFVLAGLWRIARFHVEGLQAGCYEGLPVTYNGYLFPLLAALVHYTGMGRFWFAVGLAGAAAAMVTRKIRIPEL